MTLPMTAPHASNEPDNPNTDAQGAAGASRSFASRVTRLLVPGIEAALEQFASPEALAEGKVNLIAMDAVVERFGSRWPMRREHVHDHVRAVLDRQLGAHGYHLQISETDILVCQPELGRLAAQAFCLRMLRDILSHFLGAAELATIGVHEVVRVTPKGVEARPIDPRAIAAADAGPVASSSATTVGAPQSVLGPVSVWTPFVASNGRRVEVTCSPDAVIELKRRSTIALRFRRAVADAANGREFTRTEQARLSRSDRLRIDLGTVALGLSHLKERPDAAGPPALILPISFSSLSNLDDRARIVSAFAEARPSARQGLICELHDIEGVPLATLQAAASLIAPFSLFVIGHLPDITRTEAAVLREAGLQGVATDCPPNIDDAEFPRWAKRAVACGRHAARAVLLYGVPSLSLAMVAATLGATHAQVTKV